MVGTYRELLVSLAWRLLFAAPFFYTAAVGHVPLILIVTGCLIIASPIAGLLAAPAGELFYSGERRTRPLPMYSIPESKRAGGNYEEAIVGFEQIAADYPDELKPWTEMIDIAVVDLQDAERAREIYQRGMKLLESEDDKHALAIMYSAIRSRLRNENLTPLSP
jgi:hypothetical protein